MTLSSSKITLACNLINGVDQRRGLRFSLSLRNETAIYFLSNLETPRRVPRYQVHISIIHSTKSLNNPAVGALRRLKKGTYFSTQTPRSAFVSCNLAFLKRFCKHLLLGQRIGRGSGENSEAKKDLKCSKYASVAVSVWSRNHNDYSIQAVH